MTATADHLHREQRAVSDARSVAHAERSFLCLAELVATSSVASADRNPRQVRADEINDLGFAIERQLIPDDVETLPGAGVEWVELAGIMAGARTLGRCMFDFYTSDKDAA